MSSYISSNNNRFYVAIEQNYGAAAAVLSRGRIPAVKLTAKQSPEKVQRRDKTGSRTFPGNPSGLRRLTSFGLKTYMTGCTDQTTEPGYGPLFQACLGGGARISAGGTVATATDPARVVFAAP